MSLGTTSAYAEKRVMSQVLQIHLRDYLRIRGEEFPDIFFF